MNAMSDIPVADRVSLGMAVIDDAWSRGAKEEALADATQLAEKVAPTHGSFFTVYAYLYPGIAQQQVGDWARAESARRNGLAALPASGDLNSMQPRLRRPLADVLAKQERAPEDDSVRALDPALAAMPKCTPGGDWHGCPGECEYDFTRLNSITEICCKNTRLSPYAVQKSRTVHADRSAIIGSEREARRAGK